MTMGTLGSHNSWSFPKPRTWWMRLIGWTARCQDKDIRAQYDAGVRCFDLRVRFDKHGKLIIAHGKVEYDYPASAFLDDLRFLSSRGDCLLRVIHEVRSDKEHTQQSINYFYEFCKDLERSYGVATSNEPYRGIYMFGGGCAYEGGGTDYVFAHRAPTITPIYASAQAPILDDVWPWWYANCHKDDVSGLIKDLADDVVVMCDFV